ncbi:MAG: class I SAM-dependent methyltransferase [Deinococcota bacterium]
MPKSYDRLAGSYKVLEQLAFGRLLHKVREQAVDELLDKLEPHQQVLILGEGDGRFLQSLTHKCKTPCHITCIDKSAQMLARAQAKVTPTADLHVNFVLADATRDIPLDTYDVIISLFFLDNFAATTLQTLIPKLANHLTHQGIWLLADFRQAKYGLAVWRSRMWLWLMYRFFRFVTDIEADQLVDPTRLFKEHGFLQLERQSFQHGFVVLETWQKEHTQPLKR